MLLNNLIEAVGLMVSIIMLKCLLMVVVITYIQIIFGAEMSGVFILTVNLFVALNVCHFGQRFTDFVSKYFFCVFYHTFNQDIEGT